MYAIEITDQLPLWAWRLRGAHPKNRITTAFARDREQLRQRVRLLKQTWRIDRVRKIHNPADWAICT